MSITRPQLLLVVFIVASTFLPGCSRPPYTVAQAHGKVTIDGTPLKNGKVMFAPIAHGEEKNPGKPAFGAIGPEGDYRLTTFAKDDGAVIGEHWATILSVSDLPEGVPEFDRVTSPAKVKVEPGKDNQIDIKLTREILKKYVGDNR